MAGDLPKLKLTYFDIEAAAEPVRLALTLNDVPFEDERIARPEWAELKPKTKFGQLPLLTIGEGEDAKVFAQSSAMLRYVGQLGNGTAYPNDPLTRLAIDEMDGLVGDLNRAWTPAFYMGMAPEKFGHAEGFGNSDECKATVKKLREAFVAESLPTFLEHFSNAIKSCGGYLCTAENPTIADCVLYAKLRSFVAGYIDHVPTTCLDAYPEITAYMQRMAEHPKIKAWYEAQAARKAAAAK